VGKKVFLVIKYHFLLQTSCFLEQKQTNVLTFYYFCKLKRGAGFNLHLLRGILFQAKIFIKKEWQCGCSWANFKAKKMAPLHITG
jgi:hypothetical protein